ncbi:HAD family hydrolase [Vibrio ostreicida]|uniref:HAD-IA family hydrolase n=1 Tax=Vibrio ostreicida TaxID=526588 RepID=A0ABT8C0C4_9VIBR|nr:HAD-IA family hydrolase [Vibrio ostreicida]MDN3612414.1 HAD-IA family hydrolase [Vibrio ostreicida]NPD09817.1 HAD family hydrolase [Vibrio ostreicida]
MPAVPLNTSDIKAIVFDLDNTLVSCNMDFKGLREQIGCPLNADLLTYIDELDCPESAQRAHRIILQHELDDARHSEPMPGCHNLLEFIKSQAFETAIITRNCAQAALQKTQFNQLNISRLITREHFPPKPTPDSLLALADEWVLAPHQILYVGDYLYDLQAATNADMPCCLVTHGQQLDFAHCASLVVEQLSGIIEHFVSQQQNTPPLA